jgi:hypothetical protein
MHGLSEQHGLSDMARGNGDIRARLHHATALALWHAPAPFRAAKHEHGKRGARVASGLNALVVATEEHDDRRDP